MQIEFNWQSPIAPELRILVEEKLREDFGTPHLPFKTCHPGIAKISLADDPMQRTFAGNVKCSCGNAIATIRGVSDGSRIDVISL